MTKDGDAWAASLEGESKMEKLAEETKDDGRLFLPLLPKDADLVARYYGNESFSDMAIALNSKPGHLRCRVLRIGLKPRLLVRPGAV